MNFTGKLAIRWTSFFYILFILAGIPFPANAQDKVPVISDIPDQYLEVDKIFIYYVEASGNPAPTYSLITSPDDMTIHPTVGLIFWAPTEDQVGTHLVTIQATNSEGSDTEEFNVTASGVAPVISDISDQTAIVGELFSYDVEASGIPSPTYSLTTSPSGMIINSTTGLIEWTPIESQIGTHPVTLQAINSEGSDAESFTIDVSGVEPVIETIPDQTAIADELFSYDVEATGIPAPTYSLITSPTGMTINSTTGLIEWTPAESQTGSHSVTVQAINSEGSDTESFTIDVSNVVPMISDIPDQYIEVNKIFIYYVEASGNPTPTYSLTTSPYDMTINPTVGLIFWVPTEDQVGTHLATVQATNSEGSDTEDFNVIVSGAAPVIPDIPDQTAIVGESFSYDVEASGIPDPTYSLITSPASMTINSTTGLIEWTPTESQTGSNPVTVQAINSEGSDTEDFNIFVSGMTPPVIPDIPDQTAIAGESFSYDVEASGIPDPTYSLITSPAGMTINSTTGLIEWTPTESQTGSHSVTVQATSSEGSDTEEFYVIVSGTAPVISVIADQSATVGESFSYDVEATGIPAPTYLLTTSPTGMTVNSTTGLIEWTPTESQTGSHSVTVQAINSEGSDTEIFTIDISAAETVSPPTNMFGPMEVEPDTQYTYTFYGASSNLGHTVEYQVDWGDGDISGWDSNGTLSHTWSSVGSHEVRSRARCITHTDAVSDWAVVGTVEVVEVGAEIVISSPNPNTVIPGETIFFPYYIQNTGNQTQTFYVGCEIYKNGNFMESLSIQSLTVEPELINAYISAFAYIIPSDWIEGEYTVRIYVWYGEMDAANGSMLDDDTTTFNIEDVNNETELSLRLAAMPNPTHDIDGATILATVTLDGEPAEGIAVSITQEQTSDLYGFINDSDILTPPSMTISGFTNSKGKFRAYWGLHNACLLEEIVLDFHAVASTESLLFQETSTRLTVRPWIETPDIEPSPAEEIVEYPIASSDHSTWVAFRYPTVMRLGETTILEIEIGRKISLDTEIDDISEFLEFEADVAHMPCFKSYDPLGKSQENIVTVSLSQHGNVTPYVIESDVYVEALYLDWVPLGQIEDLTGIIHEIGDLSGLGAVARTNFIGFLPDYIGDVIRSLRDDEYTVGSGPEGEVFNADNDNVSLFPAGFASQNFGVAGWRVHIPVTAISEGTFEVNVHATYAYTTHNQYILNVAGAQSSPIKITVISE